MSAPKPTLPEWQTAWEAAVEVELAALKREPSAARLAVPADVTPEAFLFREAVNRAAARRPSLHAAYLAAHNDARSVRPDGGRR